jgi:excisionase family DNA binding protein
VTEQLLTIRHAAERLKLHPKTVLRLVHEGRLRGTRIGKSYRIRDSDLNSFAGITAEAQSTALQALVTCVVEIERVPVDGAERIAGFLNAVFMSEHARMHPLNMTTAYDPLTSKLRLLLFGTPPDAVSWLQLLQVQLENLR